MHPPVLRADSWSVIRDHRAWRILAGAGGFFAAMGLNPGCAFAHGFSGRPPAVIVEGFVGKFSASGTVPPLASAGEKPFECKLCHQRSRDYSAMIKHLRTHNGASPYQCTICTEYCPSLSSMQKHMKAHKPEEIPPDWRIEKTYLYLCYV